MAPLLGKAPPLAGLPPSAWASKLVQRLKPRSIPKGLRSALPARCSSADSLPENPTKTALRSLAKNRLQLELHTLGLEATGNKPTLVNRLHAALAEQQPMQGALAQRGAVLDRPSEANAELLHLREQVAALDAQLGEAEFALAEATAARSTERRQVDELREELAELRAAWAADQESLQDAVDCARTLAESEEEVRELQAQTVHFSERVVKLQTLFQAQDDKIAELKRRLAAAQPAFAMAGAEGGVATAGGNGGAPTLEQLLASLGSGEMMSAGPAGNSGAMAEASLSASASPSSWPLDGPRKDKPAFRSDILQQPGVLGVALAAGTMSAAEAAGGAYSTVRRLAPPENRGAVDAAAVAAVGAVGGFAAWALGQM